MMSIPSHLSQSTPSLTISETDSLYMAVTTLHHELKAYAPEILPPSRIDSGSSDRVALPNNSGKCYSATRAKYLPFTGPTEASEETGPSQITVTNGDFEKRPLVSKETAEHSIERRKREMERVEEEGGDVERGRASQSNPEKEHGFGGSFGSQVAIEEAEGWHVMIPANRGGGLNVNSPEQDHKLGNADHNGPIQCLSTSTAVQSKETELHERDESFSSSIQSYDSVFTDTLELSNSQQQLTVQNNGQYVVGSSEPTSSTEPGLAMGSSLDKTSSENDHRRRPSNRVPANNVDASKNEDKRSSKDSGYGSRLNTDDLHSPSHSNSLKSSPKSLPSSEEKTEHETPSCSRGESDPDDGSLKILPLATSPVNVNKSYHQFYYFGDPHTSSGVEIILPKCASPDKEATTTDINLRGKYPSQPLLPHKHHSMSKHNQLTVKSIKAIKSASCSSLDRLSLTSSLEDYASNLAKDGENVGEENADGFKRGRLLSVTRFETFSANLETPQCATIVTVSCPAPPATAVKEKKQLKHLLSLFHFGRRKTRSEVIKSRDVSHAGKVKLRKKKGRGGHGRQRMVVSDDLTHKVNFTIGGSNKPEISEPVQVTIKSEKQKKTKSPTPQPPKLQKRAKMPEKPLQSTGSTRKPESRLQERDICLSADHATPWGNRNYYLVKETNIAPLSAELSQSVDGGLPQLKHHINRPKKLTKPSQSTTNLDLSQHNMKTESHAGLRASQSVNDLGNPVHVGSTRGELMGNGHPKEGFLWRVLGRASQRWPAMIHIIPILTNESGLRGFGVRKGQQVRALYRVSGQVIVETETNHLACVPYECCRISWKYYGTDSKLVQLSYTQLYVPIPDNPSSLLKPSSSSSSPSSSSARSSTPRNLCINTPIEMVAIQDNYDHMPVGEINIEAGDKIRILFCDEERVFGVKENGEAGLVSRNFCRLTRKSEKAYQKWVELTQSPFQSDYPVRFGEHPPSFLFDGSLDELKNSVRSKPNTPESRRRYKVSSPHSEKKSRLPTGTPSDTNYKSSFQKSHKPLPPTPQKTRKERTPISPLTKNGLRSPMSPARKMSGPLSPTSAGCSLPASPPPPQPPQSNPPPSSQREEEMCTTTIAKPTSPPPSLNPGPEEIRKPSYSMIEKGDVKLQQPFSYSGKLMTVVRSYSLQVRAGEESAIRKGLRVRVVNSSADGKTLRVATNTGTQFDIPVSHLCLSRKISEPSALGYETNKFKGHQTVYVSNSMPVKGPSLLSPRLSQPPLSPPPSTPSSNSNLPLECGKIMTVIRNFVPSPDNPMVTIRRGLRVKVLGGQDNIVKVITKSGTIFNIPRSHLRLSHKNSDASTFATEEKSPTQLVPPPPTHGITTRGESTVEGTQEDVFTNTKIPRNNSKVTRSASSVSQPITMPSSVASPSNQTNGRPLLQQGSNATQSLRGCRVNSTGSQVFELC